LRWNGHRLSAHNTHLELLKTRGDCLRHIADSKIGTISSKPNVKYPMVRLPQEYLGIIGLKAQIYKTDYDGRLAFLVVPYEEKAAQLTAIPKSKVSKLGLETDIETRLSAVESEISELKSLLLLNEIVSFRKNKNETDSEWARPDSNRRPPPCQDGGF